MSGRRERSRSRAAAFAAGMSVVLLVATPVPGWGRDDPAPHASAEPSGLERLTIGTRDGAVDLAVEVAETPEQQARGLMYRQSLAPGAGMLFDFGPSRVVTMWMKNTYIPLDMLFIDERGIVARIVRNTEPLSSAVISSGVPVRAVLEINAGAAERLGLRPGDRVDHPIFRRQPPPVRPPADGQ